MNIGTILRCGQITEERVGFFRKIGLDCFQIAGVLEEWLAPTPAARQASDAFFELFRKYDMTVPTMFLSYAGQNWADPRNGIGLFPLPTRTERMLLSCRQLEWAARYGIKLIACHAGFVPEEKGEFYDRLIADMKQLLRFAASYGQEFLFETGTETPETLRQLLEDLGEPNAGVNFDPANLLIYNNGDPAELAEKLFSRIRVVHCKDANYPAAGEVRGHETPLGKGETRFVALLERLVAGGFRGPLIIERELRPGPEQEKDIAEAVQLLKSIVKGI